MANVSHGIGDGQSGKTDKEAARRVVATTSADEGAIPSESTLRGVASG